MKTLTLFTALNTIAIGYLLFKNFNLVFKINADKTFWLKTIKGYRFVLYNKKEHSLIPIFQFYMPVRNGKKVELKEEVERMKKESPHNKLQSLSAKFSWLKTPKAIYEFEKNYREVDESIVNNLIKESKVLNKY